MNKLQASVLLSIGVTCLEQRAMREPQSVDEKIVYVFLCSILAQYPMISDAEILNI